MTAITPYPDAVLMIRDLLLAADLTGTGPDGQIPVNGSHIGRRVPADPQSTYAWLPFIRLDLIGGNDDLTTDTSRIYVDVFCSDPADSRALAETIRQLLVPGPHQTLHGVIDTAVTNTKPNQVPYGDEKDVVRHTAAYTVTARRSYT